MTTLSCVLLPSTAAAVEVAIGPAPNANTLSVTAAPGEDNALTIAKDASSYTVAENGPPTMTVGAGCAPGPGPNTATCPAPGIAQLSIVLGDRDDDVAVTAPTNAVIIGGAGNDSIRAASGADSLQGGDGNDTLDGGRGPDTLMGDAGADTVSYGARTAPVTTTKDGVANDGEVGEGDNVGADVEHLIGGLANDTIGGGQDADTLEGGPGDDTLSGGPGADQLVGGPGRDAVAYTSEEDVTVRLDVGQATSAGSGDTDRIAEVEDVVGGERRDTITGSTGANVLAGGRGEDYLDGGRGVDGLDGGASADVVVARDHARDEPVSCGPGQDLAIVDRGDPVVRSGPNRCERVDDGTRTTPRPGWVYVHPQRCAAPAAGVELGPAAMHRLVPLRYSILLASGFRGRRAPTLAAAGCPVSVRAAVGRGRVASAQVSGSAVTIGQTPGATVATTLTVKPPACGAGRRAAVMPQEPRVRVNTRRGARGRWRVKGLHSLATTFGTDWTTLESCSRTVTIVRRGRVRVYDRVKRRTVIVRAGERYVAKAATRIGG